MAEVRRLQVATGVTLTAPTTLRAGVSVPVTWIAAATSQIVTVSAYVPDATVVGWVLCKGSGSAYEQIDAVITKATTTVTITVDIDLPAGTYYLQGVY